MVMTSKMMKFHLVYLTLWSISQAAYISRMAQVNRVRAPTVFRPGVNLQRPWTQTRLMPAASHRAPYVIYRNPPHRYAVKHFGPSTTRNIFAGGTWRASARLPSLSSIAPEYEFVKAASAPPLVRTEGGTGAIHTIPAPNLSLSEKPIVVIDAGENFVNSNGATSETPKATYEVTEKYTDLPIGTFQMAKIETPIGFSKSTPLTSPELQTLIRNGAALQVGSDYGLSAIALPQQGSILPQQFTLQEFSGIPQQRDLVHTAPEGIVISPNALYQSDPTLVQKLQNQLLQRFPSVEFIPYAAQLQPQRVAQSKMQLQTQPHVFMLENEHITKQTPAPFVPSEHQKNIVQRETQEGVVVTLVPQATINNATDNPVEAESASQSILNETLELSTTESVPVTTTMKYVTELSSEEQKTTPIYYAQIGQSVGSVIANGFYSAINDVRAAAALAQVEKPQEIENTPLENVTTTAANPTMQAYFVQKSGMDEKNHTINEFKPLLGVPFVKTSDSLNVAYTLVRADNKEPKSEQDGTVYAGQIVEASITDDQDFNKQKATFLAKRPFLRLFAVKEKEETNSTIAPPKMTVVKAKIPPKSKFTFDDKTGEPVLRIYASYVDNPIQKEIITSKLANIKHTKDIMGRKPESVENWKVATVNNFDKTQGADANQVTQFGLKLRSRSDDYIPPIFEEYEE